MNPGGSAQLTTDGGSCAVNRPAAKVLPERRRILVHGEGLVVINETATERQQRDGSHRYCGYVGAYEIDDFEKWQGIFPNAATMQTASVSHAVLESSTINKCRNIGVIRRVEKK